MNPILSGVQAGYSPEDIIKYIMKAIPQMAPSIKKASRLGYPPQQILGFLSKNFETESRQGKSESERHAINRRADSERAKYGLKAAATAVAAPLVAQAATSALARALPSSLLPGGPAAPQTPNGTNPGVAGPLQSASGAIPPPPPTGAPQQNLSSQPPLVPENTPQQPEMANAAPIIPEQPPTMQSEGISTNVVEILSKHGKKDQIDKLIGSGNGPEEISAFFEKFSPKEKKAIEKDSKMPFDKLVESYISQAPKPEPEMPEEKVSTTLPTPEKGNMVATSKGMGEVKEIRNGKAIVEVDGKKHQVDEEELISSPLPEKDLADLYDDVISGIEKQTGQQVSRNVDWSGYDAGSNELAYKPHGSENLYVYDNISPEDVETLTSLLTKRKSTGENFIGAWEAGSTSPIGAAMYQLIKKLQGERGGKGNEYKSKFSTIYEALEPAKLAAKRKHAERKKKAKKSGIA